MWDPPSFPQRAPFHVRGADEMAVEEERFMAAMRERETRVVRVSEVSATV